VDVCEACGEANPAGSAFCVYCGVYLGWDEAEDDAQAARPQQPATAPTATTTGPAPTPAEPVTQVAAAEPQTPAAPIPVVPAGQSPCPACGNPNPPTRRFCGKCGHALRPSTGSARTLSRQPQHKSWWQRFRDPVDRRARRDYRRSLPLLYRWRRVLIVALVIGLTIGVAYALGRDPVGWAKARYHDLRDSVVVVDGIGFQSVPEGSTPKGYDAAALGSPEADDAWATGWTPQALVPAQACNGQKAATGMVRLALPQPERVRKLEIVSGLPEGASNRPLQFRPSRLLVVYGEGQCTTLDLKDDSAVQTFAIDTGQPVPTLTLAVAAAYPARADAREDLVALSGVTVYARPR
jgi:hypothetical protein